MLPGAGFLGGSPFALGSVFLTPQGALPTVTAAGTYDVPFNVGGSFCVTDDPHVPPPSPPDPACFSVLGTAVAHHTVIATTTPNAFFQPLPTIEILAPVPEPRTLGAGMLVLLLLLAAKYRKVQMERDSDLASFKKKLLAKPSRSGDPSATRYTEPGWAAGS